MLSQPFRAALDRKALPAPDGEAYARAGYEGPVGATEELLAQIWAELIGVERIARRDNFFELGGHSLIAMQAIARVREVLAVELALRALFEAPTIRALAERIDEARREGGIVLWQSDWICCRARVGLDSGDGHRTEPAHVRRWGRQAEMGDRSREPDELTKA
jgi:acyl carrier protein